MHVSIVVFNLLIYQLVGISPAKRPDGYKELESLSEDEYSDGSYYGDSELEGESELEDPTIYDHEGSYSAKQENDFYEEPFTDDEDFYEERGTKSGPQLGGSGMPADKTTEPTAATTITLSVPITNSDSDEPEVLEEERQLAFAGDSLTQYLYLGGGVIIGVAIVLSISFFFCREKSTEETVAKVQNSQHPDSVEAPPAYESKAGTQVTS